MPWYQELVTTDIGLLSVFTIGFILVMGAYIYRFVVKNMNEDEAKAKNGGKR